MPKTRKHLTPTEAEAKGLLCRKHLKERLRLMPGLNTKPAGSVWQGQGAYDVYNPAECVPWRWMPGRAQVRRQHVAAQAKDLIAAGCIVVSIHRNSIDTGKMRRSSLDPTFLLA